MTTKRTPKVGDTVRITRSNQTLPNAVLCDESGPGDVDITGQTALLIEIRENGYNGFSYRVTNPEIEAFYDSGWWVNEVEVVDNETSISKSELLAFLTERANIMGSRLYSMEQLKEDLVAKLDLEPAPKTALFEVGFFLKVEDGTSIPDAIGRVDLVHRMANGELTFERVDD